MAAAGPKVSVQIESGDAKTIFLEAADVWRADVIFIDAGVPTDQGLDDTAVNLITDAKCTVEVVR
jgi:hypothetical protein